MGQRGQRKRSGCLVVYQSTWDAIKSTVRSSVADVPNDLLLLLACGRLSVEVSRLKHADCFNKLGSCHTRLWLKR